jgi:hypothetical protein
MVSTGSAVVVVVTAFSDDCESLLEQLISNVDGNKKRQNRDEVRRIGIPYNTVHI